jgi:site-specific recombinase XerD
MHQRRASPDTITSYRDTFCLLLAFAHTNMGKTPSRLELDDLNAPFVCRFLDHLEAARGNCPRTRNARLAAIHSFFQYAALHDPVRSSLINAVLAIPGKRCDSVSVQYLVRAEVEALLAAPDLATWAGRRDRALLLLAVQTGLRLSELISLNIRDVRLGVGAHVHCMGKGRKERCTPLRKETGAVLRVWIKEREGLPDTAPLFPNARAGRLSPDGVQYVLRKHVTTAQQNCPSLTGKRISPHVLRHTAAMDLLQHGVDRSVIALWLGHETLDTVNVYVHANLQIKEKALAKTAPLHSVPGRFRPDDELLAFLKGL